MYPTAAKEKEKTQRKADKEKGIERVVKKKQKICEDHHDDCGEDLSSLDEQRTLLAVYPNEFDTDEVLFYQDACDLEERRFNSIDFFFPIKRKAKPAVIDPASVRYPEISIRGMEIDTTVPDARNTLCEGCRCMRPRSDWTQSREKGQCKYPYEPPWIPTCRACIRRYKKRSQAHLEGE